MHVSIWGFLLPRSFTRLSCRPRKLAPGTSARWGMSSRWIMRAIASLPQRVVPADGVGVSALMVALPSRGRERERGAHRAEHDLSRQSVMNGGDGLDAGAVLRDQVVEPEPLEGVDDPGHALLGQPAQVE